MSQYDITILTCRAYANPKEDSQYVKNLLNEDRLVKEALEEKGLKVTRKSWDDPEFDWSSTRYILFRTVWDYFERFDEFKPWLEKVVKQTICINPSELIWWNIDKHYLADLQERGVNIVPTLFIEQGENCTLSQFFKIIEWDEAIIKPSISGTARHTYRLNRNTLPEVDPVFQTLIQSESMLLQPFIESITNRGEVSHMVINGKHSHSVLKTAKPGDFRVQDDFGGTVHRYEANADEIFFAESVVAKCTPQPLYARVDVVWDNDGQLALAELEVIEPELWFREKPDAAKQLAEGVMQMISNF